VAIGIFHYDRSLGEANISRLVVHFIVSIGYLFNMNFVNAFLWHKLKKQLFHTFGGVTFIDSCEEMPEIPNIRPDG
jgi:hypothetical protein